MKTSHLKGDERENAFESRCERARHESEYARREFALLKTLMQIFKERPWMINESSYLNDWLFNSVEKSSKILSGSQETWELNKSLTDSLTRFHKIILDINEGESRIIGPAFQFPMIFSQNISHTQIRGTKYFEFIC